MAIEDYIPFKNIPNVPRHLVNKLFPFDASSSNGYFFTTNTMYRRLKYRAFQEDHFEPIFHAAVEESRSINGQSGFQIVNIKLMVDLLYHDFTRAQYQKAEMAAEKGEFDSMEHHLRSALSTIRTGLGESPSAVEASNAKKVLDTVCAKQDLGFFVNRLLDAEDDGNIEAADKYASLVLRAYEVRGIISIPPKKHQFGDIPLISGRRLGEFFRISREVSVHHRGAYFNALEREVQLRIGSLLNIPEYREPASRLSDVEEAVNSLCNICVKYIKRFIPPQHEPKAHLAVVDLLNQVRERLSDIVSNKGHPFHKAYEPVKDGCRVKGYKRRTTETQLVPAKMYKDIGEILPLLLSEEDIHLNYKL